jgi:hypothetical protein
MVDEIAEFLGRMVIYALRTRYRTQLRVAAGVGIAGIVLGGYLIARRSPPEG